MPDKPYYLAYEHRYQKAQDAGIEWWGHTPADDVLAATLTKWVDDHGLRGKRVIEFACGEGAAGVILARLGCVYHGVDVAPSAVEKTRARLAPYPNATVSLLDMARQPVPGAFDAALDVMGFHMLILDADRAGYLRNAFACLRSGAPMLFFRESYREDASDAPVETMEQWVAMTGEDYITPLLRTGQTRGGQEVELYIPLIPARARSKSGYERELTGAGFAFDRFVEMDCNQQCPFSASLFVHKP